MAHGRGSSRFPRGSSSRRQTAWSIGPATGSAPGSPQAISASGTTLATIGIGANVQGLTLIRTRGQLTLSLDTAAANGNGFVGAFGIAVVGGEAFTAGVGSLPDPQDDADDERWLYHRWFQVHSTTAVTADIGAQPLASVVVEVDSKAMRKTEENEVICAVLGVVEIGTASMGWMFASRVLDKLP